MGRVYQQGSPDSGTTTYTYDAAGNRRSRTDARGVTVNYTYDALNRLTVVDYPTNSDTVFTYDLPCANGKGRLCQIAEAVGTTSYGYTSRGQLSQQEFDAGILIAYSYDANGSVEVITYPSGRTVRYLRDMADRVTSVKTTPAGGSEHTLAHSLAYKPFGGVSHLVYGNGIARNVGYDNQYRISSLQSGSVQNETYSPDANGNIETLDDLVDPSRNKTFDYDALDRLEGATGQWGSLGWTYDGSGNRQTYVSPAGTGNYSYYHASNRLRRVTGFGSTPVLQYDSRTRASEATPMTTLAA
jgi:YD repeat-containing protein